MIARNAADNGIWHWYRRWTFIVMRFIISVAVRWRLIAGHQLLWFSLFWNFESLCLRLSWVFELINILTQISILVQKYISRNQGHLCSIAEQRISINFSLQSFSVSQGRVALLCVPLRCTASRLRCVKNTDEFRALERAARFARSTQR